MASAFSIASMRPGDVATIVSVDHDGCDPQVARQLHEMGFDDGVEIELLHRAPLGGDPLALRVGNMVVALRQRLAALIVVDPVMRHYRDAAE